MKYIDLNMVRAGVVKHPAAWRWCGYHELVRKRQRYSLLDMAEVLRMRGAVSHEAFAENYEFTICEAIERGEL